MTVQGDANGVAGLRGVEYSRYNTFLFCLLSPEFCHENTA